MFYDNSFSGTLLLWEIIISIIQALASKMHRAHPPVCSRLLLPTSDIIEMWQMLNYCYFKTQRFLLEQHFIQTLLCGITGHPAQARANYFLSKMFIKVITLKKCLNQQLGANQRSLFFSWDTQKWKIFNKGEKEQHWKVSNQILP